MHTYARRARDFAQQINSGLVWVDADAANEIAELLQTLAEVTETQAVNITNIEFALTYYGQPALYQASTGEGSISDGGLRARTALGLLRRAPLSPRFLHGEPA